MSSRRNVTRSELCGLALFAAFAVLAILNSGGYPCGASDQAFYVPAVLRQMDPALFPRDRALLAVQDHLLILDNLLAVAILTGTSIVQVMFVAYCSCCWRSPWRAGCSGARCLRPSGSRSSGHRHEHSASRSEDRRQHARACFHPRMLAFAAGTAALAALLKRRTWVASRSWSLLGRSTQRRASGSASWLAWVR